ncbi:MAG TPA: hypothetical protein VE913_24295 [Longimicrobium sp.]|nr:hypothetical protein [Longimicrobium sp.]
MALAAPAAAQAPAAPADTSTLRTTEPYRRETFRYQRGGRPDPFQPLLAAADLGYRVEDLRLTSIVYSPNPRQSIAVFAVADSSGRYRLRTGQRLGSITVVGIYPRRVDVRVDDFGISRTQSIQLQRVGSIPSAPAGPAPAGGQPEGTPPQQAPQQQAPAARPQQPSGPLRRGGRPPAAGTTTPAAQPQRPGYR